MDFMVETFTFLGFEFQNWMPIVAVALAVVFVGLYFWEKRDIS